MAFTVPFDGPINSFIDKIKKAVNDNKGDFAGDDKMGQIKISTPIGQIHGEYKIDGHNITVEVLKKPFLISEEKIKQEITKLLQ